MVEFALPKNSRITTGKTWPKPEGATNVRKFQIYRWNPDDGKNPQVDTYFLDMDKCGPMDQERDRPDADLPPFVPRRDLRVLRNEH